jgi:hypothetical protein
MAPTRGISTAPLLGSEQAGALLNETDNRYACTSDVN